ncbi:MAG: tetratricopeptide repeat protein [Planctomycetales bacterium]|nr:tetratricopeptide repeat protein [Planctomycetales bacterium]
MTQRGPAGTLGISLLAAAVSWVVLARPASAAPQDLPKAKESAGKGDKAARDKIFSDAVTYFREAVKLAGNADAGFTLETTLKLARAAKVVGMAAFRPADPVAETEPVPPDMESCWEALNAYVDVLASPKYAEDPELCHELAHLRAEMAPFHSSFHQRLRTEALEAPGQSLATTLAKNPKHREAWLLRAKILMDPGFEARNLDQAVEALQKDLEITPTREESTERLVKIHLETGKNAEAEKAARAGLEKNPRSGKLTALLGLALEAQGHVAAAADRYKIAAELDPANLEILDRWVGCAIRSGKKVDEVLTDLEAYSKKHPEHWKADELRGFISRDGWRATKDAGWAERALARFRDLEARFPKHKRVESWLLEQAGLYQEQGEKKEEELFAAVLRILRLNPRNEQALEYLRTLEGVFLADKYKFGGQPRKAIEILDKLCEVMADDTEEWGTRKAYFRASESECLKDLGQLEEAEKKIREAIRLDAREPQHNNAYALLLRLLGRTKEATDQWREAVDKKPNLLWAWENMGATYLSLGDLSRAREALTCGLEWARQEVRHARDDDSREEAEFSAWKMRRLLIEAWRLGRSK